MQKHNLLILSRQAETYKHLIDREGLPGLTVTASTQPGQVSITGHPFDLVLAEPSLIGPLVNKLPEMIWLQSTWAGVEPLMHAELRRDYILTNIRNVYGLLMSEYVFGHLLFIERQILARWRSQQEKIWDNRPYGTLKGKLLGLLGVGSIGSHLATTAKHFGMRVYGFTRQSELCTEVDRYFHPGQVNEFAADLDYMVNCLPGTDETRGIVDSVFLSHLPSRAWLINIGRGSSIDELALVDTLNNGSLAGAVLDVFIEEPLPVSHPLWSTPNTIITSHTAAVNNPLDIARVFIENYIRFVHREPLLYQVSFELGY